MIVEDCRFFDELASENARLREALAIYADHDRWDFPPEGSINSIFQCPEKNKDGWWWAEEALK